MDQVTMYSLRLLRCFDTWLMATIYHQESLRLGFMRLHTTDLARSLRARLIHLQAIWIDSQCFC